MKRGPYKNKGPCSVSQCLSIPIARGFCDKHYRRWKAHGNPNVKLRADRGKGCLDPQGYVRVPNPNGGQTFKHRLVMGKQLKRHLRKHETVHHINGDRSDNRPENLELWSKNHPYGQRVLDKIAWAVEFLEEYGFRVEKRHIDDT